MASLPRTGPRVPSYARQTGRIDREMREVHKKPPKSDNPDTVTDETVFSYPGSPIANEASPPYMIRDPEAFVTAVYASARVAPSTATTLQLLVNGSVAYSFVWDAGSTIMVEEAVNIELGEYDTIQVQFSVVGTNLFGVVVQVVRQVIQEV